MSPAGYVVMRHALRLDRPVMAYDRWMARIPGAYREAVLDEKAAADIRVETDPYSMAVLGHYRSLMSLTQEARKPMFLLRAADGAVGGHARAVQDCYRDFRALARTIAGRCGIPVP